MAVATEQYARSPKTVLLNLTLVSARGKEHFCIYDLWLKPDQADAR